MSLALIAVSFPALGADAYRTLPPLCLPCGAGSYAAIVNRDAKDAVRMLDISR